MIALGSKVLVEATVVSVDAESVQLLVPGIAPGHRQTVYVPFDKIQEADDARQRDRGDEPAEGDV